MGGLFIFVVLVMRDGIVGTIGKWWTRRRAGTLRQLAAEADAAAKDKQKDYRPAGQAMRDI
jgi:hypothetical protein